MKRAWVVSIFVFIAAALWWSGERWSGPTREVSPHEVRTAHAPRDVELVGSERQRSATRREFGAIDGEGRGDSIEGEMSRRTDGAFVAEPVIAAGEHGTSRAPLVLGVHVSSGGRDVLGAAVEFHGASGEVLARTTDADGLVLLTPEEAARGPWQIAAGRLGECSSGMLLDKYRGGVLEIELVPVQLLYVTAVRSDGRALGDPYCGELTGVWLAGVHAFSNAATGRMVPDRMRLGSDIWRDIHPVRLRSLQLAGLSRSSLPPGRGWLGVLEDGAEPLTLRGTFGEADTESVVVEARAASLAQGGAFVHVVLPVLTDRRLGTVVVRLQEPYPEAVCDLDELALDLRPTSDAPRGTRGFALEVFSDRRRASGTRTRFEVEAGTYDVVLDGYTREHDVEGLDLPLGRLTLEEGATVTIDVPLPDGGGVACADAPSDLVGRGSIHVVRIGGEGVEVDDLDVVSRDVDFEHTPLRCGWLPPGRYVALVALDGREGWVAALCEAGRGPDAADWAHRWLAGDSIDDVHPLDVDGEPQSGIDAFVASLAFDVVAGRVTPLVWYGAPVEDTSGH